MVRRPPGIELALLGFLRRGSLHGYQIHQLITESGGLGQIWYLKQSQLYALLSKLEKDGYIWGELEAQEAGRPPRRMFQLTGSGQVAYREWLQSPVSKSSLVRQEFLAKLYFARQEGGENVRKLVDQQLITCRGWLEEMKARQDERASFKGLLLQYRIGQIEATINWLESCLETVS